MRPTIRDFKTVAPVKDPVSGGGILASGTSGNLSGGTTADMTQSITSTGLLNTTLLNEVFTISGTTTATIGNIQATDTNNTTTESSTKTDGGTLAQGWQIHDTTTQTDANGNTVATQTSNDTNQNTLTLENGSLTSQGAPTPSPPGNQNPPAPGAGTSGGGSSSGGGWDSWYPQNWFKSDAEAIGTAWGTNAAKNFEMQSQLTDARLNRDLNALIEGNSLDINVTNGIRNMAAVNAAPTLGLLNDAATHAQGIGGAVNAVDKAMAIVTVGKTVVTTGVGGVRYFLPRDTGGLKAGFGVTSSNTVRSGSGIGYAKKVLDGGSGTALAGHGQYRLGSGMGIVPEGSAVTLPREGTRMLDKTAQFIERGDWDGLRRAAQTNPRMADDIQGMATYLPGADIPNYTLLAPNGLTMYSASTTVEDPVLLLDLLLANKGLLEWAACTVFRN